MNPPTTRINTIDDIEKALRLLTAQGYETSGLWAEHQAYLRSLDSPQQITDEIRIYATRAEGVTPIEDHFKDGQIEVLSVAHVTAGHQYTLSSGQRDVLRDRYGLTPTTTVQVTDLGFYMGEGGQRTNYVSSITIRSVMHIDPRNRTRVLNEVVLSPAWQFFRDSSIKDKARENEKEERAVVKGKTLTTKSPTSLALQYI